MAYDYVRLGNAISDARLQRGWSQQELANRAKVFVTTIRNLEGRRTPSRWPSSVGAVERALGKPEGWARAIAEGREPPVVETRNPEPHAQPDPPRTLIDPNSPDPVIRELSTGPVRTDAFREELIRLYLDDVAEGERRAQERAAERVRRLAAAAAAAARGELTPEQEDKRKLDQLMELQREAEAEHKGNGTDNPSQSANTA